MESVKFCEILSTKIHIRQQQLQLRQRHNNNNNNTNNYNYNTNKVSLIAALILHLSTTNCSLIPSRSLADRDRNRRQTGSGADRQSQISLRGLRKQKRDTTSRWIHRRAREQETECFWPSNCRHWFEFICLSSSFLELLQNYSPSGF